MIDRGFAAWVAAATLLVSGMPSAMADASSGTNIFGINKVSYDSAVPADRPGFGDNVNLVPKGWFEMEGGLRFSDDQGGGTTTTVPSGLLLRTGIANNVEFRLGFDGYQVNAPGADGAGNASVGFKVRVHDQTHWTPSVSLLPTITLPVGDDQVASSKATPSLHFIWSKDLSQNFSVGGNVNLTETPNSTTGNRHLDTAVSLAGNYSFTQQLGGYAEYYTVLRHGDSRDTHAVDGGATYLVTRHTQLDAYVGTGLNDATSNVYGGLGIAHLF